MAFPPIPGPPSRTAFSSPTRLTKPTSRKPAPFRKWPASAASRWRKWPSPGCFAIPSSRAPSSAPAASNKSSRTSPLFKTCNYPPRSAPASTPSFKPSRDRKGAEALLLQPLRRVLPPSRLRRACHRVYHRHIPQRIFKCHRRHSAFPHRARKPVALQRVLIAGRKFFHRPSTARPIAPIVDRDARSSSRSRIEGNLRLDLSLRPVKSHALLLLQLHAARENAVPRRVFQNRRRQHIHAVHSGVPRHRADTPDPKRRV